MSEQAFASVLTIICVIMLSETSGRDLSAKH